MAATRREPRSQGPDSKAGKAFLDMLGVFAEFETNLRRERQLEGISAAKASGVYKGRRPSMVGSALPIRFQQTRFRQMTASKSKLNSYWAKC
jgi:DNA invertase Pin-like site-specific DNA recombinase